LRWPVEPALDYFIRDLRRVVQRGVPFRQREATISAAQQPHPRLTHFCARIISANTVSREFEQRGTSTCRRRYDRVDMTMDYGVEGSIIREVYSVDVNLKSTIPSREACHEAGHAVMADLCSIEISRVTITSGQDVVGMMSTPCHAPDSAQAVEDRRLLQKHVLILLAGRAAEERACPGITNVVLRPIHLHDYHGPNRANDLISRWTVLTGESVSAELELWEHRAESAFADDCLWGAVCRIAFMLDAAEKVDGEQYLTGAEVRDILARLIPNEKREAFTKDVFG